MTSYNIEVTRTAEKQLRKMERKDQIRVLEAVQSLGTDPRPRGCRKLRGFEDVYRIRVGTFRVIYSISDERVLVIVLKVGRRQSIYT